MRPHPKLQHLVIAVITVLGLGSFSAMAEGSGGLQTSVAVDALGQFKTNDTSAAQNRFDIREGEVMFYAPIDHLFDGVFSAAAHRESGVYNFEIHEAFLSTTRLVPRARFRLGKFFLGVGRLNQFHRHDWPFVDAPRVQSEFFDDEAAVDTGGEAGWLLPVPFYLDLTVGVTNGWTFGHSHSEGASPQVPTHYVRLAHYQDLFNEGGAQFGLNYLGRKDHFATTTNLMGVDVTAKWRDPSYLSFLFQSEVWYRITSPTNQAIQREFGLYLYPQKGLSALWSFGFRVDYFANLTLTNADGRKIGNADWAFVPTLTLKPSEFSTFRLAYKYGFETRSSSRYSSDYRIQLQTVFILGAHPSHDF